MHSLPTVAVEANRMFHADKLLSYSPLCLYDHPRPSFTAYFTVTLGFKIFFELLLAWFELDGIHLQD